MARSLFIAVLLTLGAGPGGAWAGDPDTVVFLTSITAPARTLSKLESDFSKALERARFRSKVIHFASRHDLHETLTDPSTMAVFWMSHTVTSGPQATGIGMKPILLDHQGYDVMDMFRVATPRIRWIGIIGCSSNALIGTEIERILGSRTKLFGFDKPVRADKGLNNALKVGLNLLKTEEPAPAPDPVCADCSTFRIRLTRKLDATLAATIFPSVSLEVAGKTIGVLPGFDPNRDPSPIQTAEFEFELPSAARMDQIKIQAGTNYSQNPLATQLGAFEIETSWQPRAQATGTWRPITRPDGRPHGVYSHIYIWRP